MDAISTKYLIIRKRTTQENESETMLISTFVNISNTFSSNWSEIVLLSTDQIP